MHIDDNVRAGMSPAEARRQALVKLGGVERLREDHRDRAGVPILRDLGQDVRYSLRLLRRTPSFTAVAVLTLGLGIGANTAVFSVVNAVLLRPLPYPDPGRLMFVWATNARNGLSEDVASYPDFEEWRARSHSFEGLAAFTSRAALLAGAEQAETVPALQAAPGFFELFGVSPSLGRVFRPEDAVPGAPPVVVLSNSLWQRQFAARSDVVGQTIHVNERPATIVGVMPAGVSCAARARGALLPLMPDPSRNHGFLLVAGRLNPASAGVRRRPISTRLPRDRARLPKPIATSGSRHAAGGCDGRPRAARLVDVPRRRRAGPADRVHQRRQPHAREERVARARDRGRTRSARGRRRLVQQR